MRACAAITVQFGPAAAMLSKPGEAGDAHLIGQIRAGTQDWLDALNLPVDARVELTQVDRVPGPGFIDVAVILNGVRCGFSKRQVALAYESAMPGGLADHAAGVKAARELLADAAAKKSGSAELAQAFLASLVCEAVQSSAERVIVPEVAEALLALALAREPGAAVRADLRGLDRDLANDVLRRLTRVHIGVPDAPDFEQSLFRAQVGGATAADLAEAFIDEWRTGIVEIRVNPARAKALLKNEPEVGKMVHASELAQEPADLLRTMCEGLFYDLGVWFSRIALVADAKLPPDGCRFRIHQRMTPVRRGLGLEFGAIVPLLAAELRLAASTLLSLADVEDLLGRLNEDFPALVSTTLHRYSPLEVAQVLRSLLRDGVSIRDLRGVLELLLDFSCTAGVRSPTGGWGGRDPYLNVGDAEFTREPYFTANDPYVPQFDIGSMQLFAEPAPEWLANGRLHAEFVKCGMRRSVTSKVSRGQNTVICHLLDADIEKRLLAFRAASGGGGDSPFSESELSEILRGIGAGLADGDETPVLFLATTPDVALLVQEMIAHDFPEVNVLHRQSVAESANVQLDTRVPARKAAVSAG